MRIVTWNINSVRLRLDLLKKLTEQIQPDVIALQETKSADEFFPLDSLKQFGYEHIVFAGEKSYNGVAILSKFPIANSFSCKFFNEDKRHIAAVIQNREIHNFYVPAGGDEPDVTINAKFAHKLEYLKMMQQWFSQNRSQTDEIILVGDLNVAPHEHDVWSSKQLANVVSHTQVERQMLMDLQNSFGFIDTARYFTTIDQKLYSWWSYRNRDWEKSDRGRRLDHIWVSSPLQATLKAAYSLKEARGWDKPSDHVPFIVQL